MLKFMAQKSLEVARRKARQALKENSSELDFSDMGLAEIPEEVFRLNGLKNLNLSRNKLKSIPTELFLLKNLETLELAGNPVSELPAEIGDLKNLKYINLTEMELSEFPSSICNLKNLEILYAGYNNLKTLPKGFSKLGKLRGLFLHDNDFSVFPAGLRNHSSLVELTIGKNIRQIPKRIASFRELNRLCLIGNNLESLPSEIADIEKLSQLELNGNSLKEIPTQIGFMPNLSELNIRGNDLPASLLSAERDGSSVLLAQIRSLSDPENVTPLFEAKLMITGEGKVGKSCLRMALDGSIDPKLDLQNSTTWGVDCGTLFLEGDTENEKPIQFNYWDFGGQKIYRITHQFFYSDQGLYLLVWDPRLGEEQCLIHDWLIRISARTAGEAKVILVATHADVDGGNYSPEVDLTRYDANLRALVVEQISVDSFTGKNIDALKAAMARHVKGMPGIASPINKNWDASRKKALSHDNPAPWMSYKEFSEICFQEGIEDEEAVRSIAATFLHRLGRGVWYGIDWENDPFLQDTIVRDPSWLAMAFMEIVEHEPTKLSGGMLDHNHLTDVWIKHGRETDGWRVYDLDDHQRLMRMMRAQGVALPTKSSNGERSLIPQLVPTNRPEMPWSDPGEVADELRVLRMQSKIEPVIDGFMSHLIASLEPYHYYLENGVGTFWKDGIFLRDAEGRFKNDAVVKKTSERNFLQLDISVAGDEPGFLLQQIDAAISECLKFWPGAKRSDSVACPHKIHDRLCIGTFRLQNVERWLQRGQENAICQECDQVTTPSDLIYGLRDREISHNTAEHLVHYLAYKEQRPAPSSIVLLPAKARWKEVRSWEVLGRSRMKAQLRSEFSGALVAEKEFTATPGLLKYLGPVAKLGALFFAAIPLPLDLSPEITESFGELGDSLDKLGDQLPSGEERPNLEHQNSSKNLNLVAEFLTAIQLSPKAHGMDLERAPDGKWYWMTSVEVEQHRPTQATINPSVG